MPNFQYKARDQQGKLQQGVMTAESQKAVADKLQDMSLVPVTITVSKGLPAQGSFWDRFRRVKFTELNLFTRQLYTLQRAGLPIIASLNALREQSNDHAMQEVIGRLIRDLEGGANMATAFERHPEVFSPLYVNMIKAGEISGRLPEVLQRLAMMGEYEEKLQRKIKSALRYPLMVVFALVIGFMVLITVVVPKFQDVYSSAVVELPLATKILIATNMVISRYWWVMVIVLILAVVFIRRFIRTEQGSWWFDQLKLNTPVLGPLFRKISMGRFGRITSMLMKSGVPLMMILDLVKESVGNRVLSRAIDKIKDSVNEGRGMLEPMKESKLFPPVVTQMIAVGEETGNLDELLLHVAEYYDEQVEYTVSNLVSLIEPILILILGIGVTIMALGIFTPMWQLMKVFKGG